MVRLSFCSLRSRCGQVNVKAVPTTTNLMGYLKGADRCCTRTAPMLLADALAVARRIANNRPRIGMLNADAPRVQEAILRNDLQIIGASALGPAIRRGMMEALWRTNRARRSAGWLQARGLVGSPRDIAKPFRAQSALERKRADRRSRHDGRSGGSRWPTDKNVSPTCWDGLRWTCGATCHAISRKRCSRWR